MSKKPEIKIQTLNNQLQTIDSLWYTRLPQDTKNQNRNNYLDSIVVTSDWTNVTGINNTDVVNITSNYTDIPMTIISEKSGNLDRKINASWWIEIPVDWTYIVTIEHAWAMYPTIVSATVVWAYWTKALIPLMYPLEKEWDTPVGYVYLNAYTFYTRQAIWAFTYHWTFKKGNCFYARAAHMRTGQTFPVLAGFYITKIS